MVHNDKAALVERHLDWSAKQGRILTAGGNAESYFHADRGFAFDETELPHFHLQQSQTRVVFEEWKEGSIQLPMVGAWSRPLFYGGWEHSSDQSERVYNVQTSQLFIDLRIPRSRSQVLTNVSSLETMTAEQLAFFARQHVFAGYSKAERHDSSFGLSCTRHHCIDWNYVGVGRSLPNKWWIELQQTELVGVWKEWAFATDHNSQHYYCERWERYDGGSASPVLALRKAEGRDGILVAVGDHFNYCLNRKGVEPQSDFGSLVALVDAALQDNDLDKARRWLSVQGGHGRVSKGWMLDCAIEMWREGTPLWTRTDIEVVGSTMSDCEVIWNGEKWTVFESSFSSVEDLRHFLASGS